MNKSIVIIPTYNEEKNILKVLNDLKNIPIDIVIVDDGSSDNTKEIVKKYMDNPSIKNKIYTIFKNKNEGKSKAIRDGTELALKLNYEYIVYMDGDYQHKPKDIPKMFKKLKKHNGDAIFGIRKYSSIPFHRQISNYLASTIMSLIISIYVGRIYFFKDIQCGFRIIKGEFLKDMYYGEGYSVEHLIAIQLAKKNAKIIEEYIDIEYHADACSHITTKKILSVVIEVAKYVLLGPKKRKKENNINK